MTGNASGPFDDESQARAAAHAVADPGLLPIKAAEKTRKLLSRALEAAGVELGAYNHRIIGGLRPARPAGASRGRELRACPLPIARPRTSGGGGSGS